MEKGSSSAANGSGDSLNGLKFGKKIYFEDVGDSGSSSKSKSEVGKKGKGVAAVGGGLQKAARCQVEGCNLDLTGLKAYYCRHKVCGMHSKSPRVVVAGLEQRFCQQCSRFHLLSEFDQGKRSCRRRLAGHNERRRKPPPGPLTTRCGRLSSFHEDNSRYRSFLMDFTYPRPPGASRDIWSPTMRNNDDHAVNNQWHGSFGTRVGVVSNNQCPAFFSAPEQASSHCLGGVSDSSCALSLLSTQPWGSTIAAEAPPRNLEAPLISSSTRIDGGQMAQLNMASSYMNNPWAFRDLALNSSLEMGLRQLPDNSNGHFSSELELALQDNRQCPDELGHREIFDHDHSVMHWSL